MKTQLTFSLTTLLFLAGCASSPALTSGASRITQVDEYVFFQRLPEAVRLFGGVRTKSDEDRRAAVKEAANYAKDRGCNFIALITKYGTPESITDELRANKLRWIESGKRSPETIAHERGHMVKTPDERVFRIYDKPEDAFGSGMEGRGNVWACLKAKGENITRPELLVDPKELI